jgi:hypothetical protein
VSLMYNGSRPGAARRAQWNLFRLLGANGVVIPADTASTEPLQLGGEPADTTEGWIKAASPDTAAADTTETKPDSLKS